MNDSDSSALVSKLESLKKHFNSIKERIADPSLPKNHGEYEKVMREYSRLDNTMSLYNELCRCETDMTEARILEHSETDTELCKMARDEILELEDLREKIIRKLKVLIVPPGPLDGKDIIVEIRAGTGGDEASLFASDLYRMYGRYSENQKWKTELLTVSETEAGGFKEVIFSINGRDVYGKLRYESGVHRVQRIPVTESQGRIHTSAVTVAILPEAEETDIQINENDLKIDVYRSSGPGGQSVNTTDSAVRITHLPTSMVVICQDEKSQLKNKNKALRVLRSRLYELEEMKKQEERAEQRKNQVGSGDRSQRIRTYNYPQGRITDHRINLTLYKLEQFMQGEIDEVLDALHLSATESVLENG